MASGRAAVLRCTWHRSTAHNGLPRSCCPSLMLFRSVATRTCGRVMPICMSLCVSVCLLHGCVLRSLWVDCLRATGSVSWCVSSLLFGSCSVCCPSCPGCVLCRSCGWALSLVSSLYPDTCCVGHARLSESRTLAGAVTDVVSMWLLVSALSAVCKYCEG